LNISNCRRWS